MNAYPSWIKRIPEMIEHLALVDTERIDRLMVERLFDLRRTAAKELLRRMGASLCGHSFVISRGLLMARLREAQEKPDWKWEAARRLAIQERIAEMRPPSGRRPSVVPVTETLRQQLEVITAVGLPTTIQLAPGCVTIHCQDMPDLLQQLVQLAKALDNDYAAIQRSIAGEIPHRPVASEAAPVPARTAKGA